MSVALVERTQGRLRCPGQDPLCPCQDGDACHYRSVKLPDGTVTRAFYAKPEARSEPMFAAGFRYGVEIGVQGAMERVGPMLEAERTAARTRREKAVGRARRKRR